MKIDEISTHPTESDTNSREILSPPEDISRSFPVRNEEGSDENGTKKCTIIINKAERERAEKEQENLSKKGEKKFKCHFDKSAKLGQRVKRLHEKPTKISIDKNSETNQNNISKNVHDEGENKCHSCDKAFDKAAKLYKHIKDVHEKKITCDICEKKFTYTRDLKSHAKNVHKMPI